MPGNCYIEALPSRLKKYFVILFLLLTRGHFITASTASEYPLADFALFRSLARTVKIACWDIPDPYKKRRLPMANRKRNIQMKFYVTEEEKRLIDEKMAQLPTRRYGAYLRKMAIDGYIPA